MDMKIEIYGVSDVLLGFDVFRDDKKLFSEELGSYGTVNRVSVYDTIKKKFTELHITLKHKGHRAGWEISVWSEEDLGLPKTELSKQGKNLKVSVEITESCLITFLQSNSDHKNHKDMRSNLQFADGNVVYREF